MCKDHRNTLTNAPILMPTIIRSITDMNGITSVINKMKRLFINRVVIGISFYCLYSLSAFSAIPPPMQEALTRANISEDNVSLLITPVSHLSYSSTLTLGSAIGRPSSLSSLSNIIFDNIEDIEELELLQSTSESIKLSTDPSINNTLLPIRHNADIPRTPASTMKLIPTFIALDLLGRDFTWMTHVYHTGVIIDNTLYGNLLIKGSGDPKLTHRRLERLLGEINNAGIRHIKGDIILDASIFRNVTKDPADFDNDPIRPYNASPDGFLVNFSSIEITTTLSGSQTLSNEANVYYTPKMADDILPENIPLTRGGCQSARKSIAPSWQDSQLVFKHALPISCGYSTFYVAHPDAKTFAANVTKQKWLMLGNTLTGRVISTETPKQNRFGLYIDNAMNTSHHKIFDEASSIPAVPAMSSPLPMISYPSLPLSEQIYDINHYSNNVMTEQILLSLAVYHDLINEDMNTTYDQLSQVRKQSTPALALLNAPSSDYTRALATVNEWWQTHLTTPPPYMTNGSGLCRTCTVTADNLNELLEYAYHHPDFETYASSMGIAGISGTIRGHRHRLPHSAAIGRALIKTGTLDNVTAMAGYVQGQSGQDYIVVGIINTPHKLDTTKARYALDTMLDWTARQ